MLQACWRFGQRVMRAFVYSACNIQRCMHARTHPRVHCRPARLGVHTGASLSVHVVGKLDALNSGFATRMESHTPLAHLQQVFHRLDGLWGVQVAFTHKSAQSCRPMLHLQGRF